MGVGKWISGVLGWALAGPIGALLGFSLGSLFEGVGNAGRADDTLSGMQGQRNSFMISLLVLSAAVMKSDGKVMRSELDYVKGFIRVNFGEGAVAQALQIMKKLLGKEIDLPSVCAQIKAHMDISQRLQLMHYLIGIAQADGHVSAIEVETLKNIALYMGISRQESDSLFAMFSNSLDDAYKVLELTPDASDEEVKRAYKRLAFKHHPDRVESLGADVRKSAEEKFKTIVAAYETIKKERGFN